MAGPKLPKLKKTSSDMTSTQVLRDLEISLRTNNIHWVRDFLSDQLNGLDILVAYLSLALSVLRLEVMNSSASSEHDGSLINTSTTSSTVNPSRSSFLGKSASTLSKKMKQSHSKLGLADAIDDIHVGVQCLRAIMNHQHGFNLVFQHTQAINCITLSLNHKNLRTKTLVLELLAAVCLVSGGHEIIFKAFDNFKEVCGERRRFETLMRNFLHFEEFHIDFMVACMQFINIAVHSVEEMNYRVHLQHEFTLLGLDQYLNTLSNSESDRLLTQVNAYMDNKIEVRLLLEDSDTKNMALDHAAELDSELSFVDKESELATLKEQIKRNSFASSLPPTLPTSSSSPLSPLTPPCPPTSLNIPPPPPAPPMMPLGVPGGGMMLPPPPPPIMGFGKVNATVPIKKVLHPRHRLPILNWVAMKPNQVKGTVFADLDDEKLYQTIDFHKFEDVFRLNQFALDATDEVDGTPKSERRFSRRPEAPSLLEPNRLRNVAITKRKIEMSNEMVVSAIQNLNLKMLSLERVEALLRILPTEQEVKAFREYEGERKSVEVLADEDKFLIALTRVERLQQRLKIMSYIGNFFDSYQHLQPIVDTRSTSDEHRQSLTHFLATTITSKFPDLLNFDLEFQCVEKASAVSLDNILADVNELDKGMQMVNKEMDGWKDRSSPVVATLTEFTSRSADLLKKLHDDCTTAQESYQAVVSYFGETSRTMVPTAFFSLFVRFTKAYRQSLVDLENWKKQETLQSVSSKEKLKGKNQQLGGAAGGASVASEMKRKFKQVKEKRVISREEVYHGALEDILLDLKNEPYRRADGIRRNNRAKPPPAPPQPQPHAAAANVNKTVVDGVKT
ncbi:hypothetical protein HELRODRAFT_192864 [Helobdella robusta]|uniref:Formin-like protein n=1 Tax=Helobdella robusta TaxID=6412 RepID=T1FUD5_HELRO|nr:hypothetical protein HELRODRAFT_192864 [Helobdella robusta]ESN99595.1 hypothetical protein HELRODRAFT_192864 [Helobdella robusta]